jgi:hypothetical protein
MPYGTKKNPQGGYDIVKSDTGKKVGHSDTKAKAQSSINARNAGAHGWKGTKKK